MNKLKNHLVVTVGFGILVGALALLSPIAGRSQSARAVDREDAIQPYGLDVYILNNYGLLENPNATTLPEARLFNLAGTDLGLSWGVWQRASAMSETRCIGGSGNPRTEARIWLSGLIPGGVYSVFHATFGPDSRHPLCPSQERLLPLTAFRPERQLPDPASFIADADGEAVFRARVEGCLLDATRLVYGVIYHFDGQTYYPLPNRGEFVTQGPDCRSSFGVDAMRQFFIVQKQ